MTGVVVEAGRAALGVWHLARAARPASARAARPTSARAARPAPPHRALHGVLAVRQLGQALLVARVDTRDAHTLSALVDVLHGTSMVPLALAPRFRRFAIGQAAVALVLAIAEVASVGTGRGSARGRGAVGGRR